MFLYIDYMFEWAKLFNTLHDFGKRLRGCMAVPLLHIQEATILR